MDRDKMAMKLHETYRPSFYLGVVANNCYVRARTGTRPSRPTHRNSGLIRFIITSTTKTNFHSHLQHGLGAAIDHHLGHGLRFLEEVIHGWERR